MSSNRRPSTPRPRDVRILILDDDEHSQAALWQVLDSEGWEFRVAPLPGDALRELARGNWTLVIANVAMTGIEGSLFATLKELALAPPAEAETARLRVLFLVPELAAADAQSALEAARLPYVLKPFHLHDFLEKVSDLLLDAHAIGGPIRRVRTGHAGRNRRRAERRSGSDRRQPEMFASRDDFTASDEEVADSDAAEAQKEKEARRKREAAKKHLGEPKTER